MVHFEWHFLLSLSLSLSEGQAPVLEVHFSQRSLQCKSAGEVGVQITRMGIRTAVAKPVSMLVLNILSFVSSR